MLEQMHRHMKWIMWIIVGLITIAFLFFGIYPSDERGAVAAKVNGQTISQEEFNRVYQNMYQTYRDVLKDQFNESFAQGLRAQALRGLIAERLLVQEAERKGLRVTDEELQKSIMAVPSFQQQGKFSRKNYDNYLRYVNLTPKAFEARQREELLKQKLVGLVEEGVSVTDAEVARTYAERNPKATPGDFEKNRETFRRSALEEKKQAALDAFIAKLQAGAKIKIYERL